MINKLAYAVAVLSAVLLAFVPSGNADCCGTVYNVQVGILTSPRCADCSWPTDDDYCPVGSGGCNIFGCNCEGGCRPAVADRKCSETCCSYEYSRKARSVQPSVPLPLMGNFTGNDVVDYVDTNKDGKLDALELNIIVTRHGLPADTWRHLDVDGDDHLSAHEIDSNLVPTLTVKV